MARISVDETIGESNGLCTVDPSGGNGTDATFEQFCQGRDCLKSRYTYEHDICEQVRGRYKEKQEEYWRG